MKNKALFLDRDGVINRDYGHVYQINKFHLIPNIKILIRKAMANNYKIIIITNQAGIGKELYSNDDFEKITQHMKELFLRDNLYIDAVYHCSYHPTMGVGKYLKDSFDRKPNPGMLLKAQKDFNIDMDKSIFIGDKISDMEAGISALVKINILFNEKAYKNKKNSKNEKNCSSLEITNLREAIKYL